MSLLKRTDFLGSAPWITVLLANVMITGIVASSHGTLRLVEGSNYTNGRVEVYILSVDDVGWGTVCDGGWDNDDAQVVCRQLGFGSSGTAVQGYRPSASSSVPIWLDNVNCYGNENKLIYCGHSGIGSINDCVHQDDSGVICQGSLPRLPVRLADGNSAKEGRVEIYYEHGWTTVCDDGWDDNDASVVCRQLGLSSSGTAFGRATFGEGTGTILLDNVGCTNTESNIFECHHGGFENHDCGHDADAGVRCYDVSPSIVSLLNTTVTAEGNTLTITCEATGYPLPTIVWSKVNGDLSSRVSVGENIANKLLSVRGTLTLTNVTKDDTGLYECSASNYLGSDADYVMITIQYQAMIFDGGLDTCANETNQAMFLCQATGEPVANISWYFNGVMINVLDTSKYMIVSTSINKTAIENTLIVYSVTSSDVGTYTCNAINSIGNDKSSGILTINVIPDITSPAERQIHYTQEGQTTTLSCISTGYPPPLVVWERSGEMLSEHISISNTTMSTNIGNITEVTVNLTITNVSREDSGYYTCSSTNLLGGNIKNVSLIVQFQPGVISEVNNQVENATHQVLFVCQVIGEPVPNISWYFNGVMTNVSDTTKYRIMSTSLNTTTTTIENTLTVYNVTSSDVGTYTCNATNIIGNDQSPGILTVNVSPNITSPSEGQIHYTQEGQTTTLSCISTGYPPPLVVWERSGEILSEHTSISNTTMSTNMGNITEVTVNLTITNVSREDTGYYTCSATNLLTTDIRNLSLVTQFGASIFEEMLYINVDIYQTATTACQATGEPVPNISWYFNGVMINVSDTNKYMIMSTSLNTTATENTLTVYNVTSSDVGNYTCFASNAVGNDSKDGYLQVNVAPFIYYPINDGDTFKVPQDDNITINCSAVGFPPPSLHWMRQGAVLDDERVSVHDGPVEYSVITNITRVTVSLVITNASRDDIDQYICTAENFLGKVSRIFQLIVQYHVNIESQSGHDVINDSIINAFNNAERSVVLHCVTVRHHENATWKIEGQTGPFDTAFTILNFNTYSSSVMIIDTGISISAILTCMSQASGVYRSVTITTENPFLQLHTPNHIEAVTGTRPVITYTIAVDADGTREGQNNLSSVASITFANSRAEEFSVTEQISQFRETSFQNYSYVLPPLDNSLQGNYTLSVESLEGDIAKETVSVRVDQIDNIQLTTLSHRITVLQGDSITLQCLPSQLEIAIQWFFDGVEITTSSLYQLSPPILNHNLTIPHLSNTNTGDYLCVVNIKERIETSITLNVVPTCLKDFSNGLLWPTSRRNTTRTLKCSELHPNLRPGVTINRFCKLDGNWGTVDFSSCTALPDAIPIVIVSFEVNVSKSDAKVVSEKVKNQLENNSNVSFESIDPILYDLTLTGKTGISLKLTLSNENFELMDDHPKSYLSSDIAIFNYVTDIYIPGSNCSCLQSEGKRKTICKGPSLSPCYCNAYSCQCNSPFVGRDGSCGLDSDGDRFPDVQLNCAGPECEKDECVDDYSVYPNGTQNPFVCNPPSVDNETFIGCHSENDTEWGIRWPTAMKGETIIQSCPGGVESVGLASRLCDGDPVDWQEPNVENCSTVEITRIMEEAKRLEEIAARVVDPNNADLTVNIEPEVLQLISSKLADITSTIDEAILPNDLGNTLDDIPTAIGVNILEDLVDISDNILDSSNMASFSTLNNQEMDKDNNESQNSVGTQVLQNTARLSVVVGNTLKVDGNESANITIVRKNMVIDAQLLSQAAIDNGTNITFPMEGNGIENISATSKVPAAALKEYPGVVTNTYLSNPFFLPNDFDGDGKFNLSSPVLVVKLTTGSTNKTQLPMDGNLLLTFSESENSKPQRCVFWQPHSSTWSDEGLITTRDESPNDSNLTICQSSHLTSFAVMVDVKGASESSPNGAKALSIVSYIGCGISILALLLTMLAILFWRKSIFKGIHNLNHFNLALSLTVGLIIFVSGIETARENKIACRVVAGLLQYFFLAAFSWMLCEGIYLFVHLNFIFYTGFFTKRYFYVGLGWGLPIPIVAISAGISHNHYGTERVCWLSEEKGTIWAFVAPMLLIILVNFIFLVTSLRLVYMSKRRNLKSGVRSRTETSKSLILAAVLLLPLLGSTWIIGMFAVTENTIVISWIFTVLNSLQGFFIFLFYVVKQEKVREKVHSTLRFNSIIASTIKRNRKFSSEYSDTIKFGAPKSMRSDSVTSQSIDTDHRRVSCSSVQEDSSVTTSGESKSSPNASYYNEEIIHNAWKYSSLNAIAEEDSRRTTVIHSICSRKSDGNCYTKNTKL